jgi:galacturan 1,4-alpha-galacturonidase
MWKPIATLQLLLAVAAVAAPAVEERSTSISRNNRVGPKPPFRPLPDSTHRTKVCKVDSHGDGRDDSDLILAALEKCNNGGRAVFDKQYTIGTALNLQFLKHIDIGRLS